MASLKYWLWLASLKGLGGQTRLALLRHFGDPESVYYADPGEIRLVEHITKEQSAVLENKSMKTAEKILWANLKPLEELAEELLKKESLDEKELEPILKNVRMPA